MLLSAAWVVFAAVPAAAQTPPHRPVTFSKDIAPILQRSCQMCHRPEGIAPMSLLTYQEARPYARAMKQRTALARSQYGRGAMPPWYIEKNIGIQKFKDDPSLSDEEIALVAAWADSDAPEGDPADLPPPRTFAGPTEWTVGKPDLIVSSPTVSVKGIGADWWGDGLWRPQPIGNTEDRYVRSAEYKETLVSGGLKSRAGGTVGGRYVIHHAGSSIISGEQVGGQSEAVGESLPGHEVGRNGDVFPDDAGKVMKASSYVAYGNVHLHPSGVPGDDRTVRLDLGFRLHPKGYKPKYVQRSLRFGRSEIAISANQDNQSFEAYWVAPQPIRLVNFEPHLHATGVRKCLQAIYQWSIETLNCAGYDHNWVKTYNYDENGAPLLPKGTILKATAWFDNTSKNTNVLDPRNQSNWMRRSVGNMFIVFEQGVFLTDQEYEEELEKRRKYLDETDGWEELFGCPGCWERPATPATR